MRFLATYRVRNDITFVSHGEATEYSDGMHSQPVLPRKTTNQLIADLISTPNNNLVYHLYDYDPKGKYDHKSRELNKVLGEYSYSETAFLYISLLMHDYQQALEEYRETEDDAFYIRHQLAWLNQDYYKDRWVTYSACMAELMEFLNENEGLWMRKQEQDVFARRCTTLLMRFPILPSKLKRNFSKYEKDESLSLGLKRLNECLIDMDIPYHIVSHQRGADHKTQWKLEHK